MIELRDYQSTAKDAVQSSFLRGNKRVLLVGATAFGKTIVAASIIKSTLDNGKRVLFLADRISLIDQTSQRMHEYGIEHGVIQADRSFNRSAQMLICSQQTLEKRGFIDSADLVILDEAHCMRKKTTELVRALDCYVIGLTATPMTDGLGEFYEDIVNGASTRLLQDQKWLIEPDVYIATEMDMTQATVSSSGEWTDSSAEAAAIPIIGDIVTDWVTNCHKVFNRTVKTLAYVPTVAFGHDLCRQFNAAGYRFEQVSYKNTTEENQRNISSLRKGTVQGLVSVDALVKGIDIPDVECLIAARPYRSSLASHIQMIGRLLRSHPGKETGLLNDHCGNYLRFAAEAEAFWNTGIWDLSNNSKEYRKRKQVERDVKDKDRKCRQCSYILPADIRITTCPACGFTMPQRKPREIVLPGVMRKYERLTDKLSSRSDLWRALSTCSLNRYNGDKMRAQKFALAKYRQFTGAWPTSNTLDLSGYYNEDVEDAVQKTVDAYKRKLQRERKNERAA